MAIAVIGGLISSTALSLVLVPVVYEVIDDFENWIRPKLARLTVPREPESCHPLANFTHTTRRKTRHDLQHPALRSGRQHPHPHAEPAWSSSIPSRWQWPMN